MSGNKTHTNRFCRCTGKYKALNLNAQSSQALSVLLRPRALYFPVQHKTGEYVHSQKKFTRLAAFGIKTLWPVFNTNTIIPQSRANLAEKIFIAW